MAASVQSSQGAQAPRSGTIRIALIVAFVLAVLLPVSVNTAFAVSKSLETAGVEALNQLQAVANLKRVEVTSWVEETQSALEDILADPSINWVLPISGFPNFSGDSAVRLNSHFAKSVGDNQRFEALFLMDSEGVIQLSTDVALNKTSLASQVDVKRAWDENLLITPHDAEGGQHTAITFLHPVKDTEGAMLAVIGGRVSLKGLNTIMQARAGLGESGEIYLIDADFHLLTDSRFPDYPIGSTLVDTVLTRRVFTDAPEGAGQYRSYRNVDVIGVAKNIPQLNVALIAEREQAETFAPTYQTLVGSMVLAIASVVVAVLLGLWFANRRITTPLGQLSAAAEQVSGGNLNVTAPVKTKDEFGLLAQTFNTMTAQLREAIDKLEERVAARTAELAEAQKRAEKASQAKTVFLSNISHELRTPLNVIIGYTSSMLDMPSMYNNEKLPPVYRKDIDLIMANGQYLLGLINDTLDLSKIEAGRLELQRSAVDLTEIFKGVIATSIGLLRDKPVQIRADFSERLPKVYADPVRIRQVVLNLMSNAVKFTQAGSITLQARIERNQVRVAVIDTGIGIPEKALAHIFDRYQQAESGTERQYGGTGLGLDISKQLCQMHGSDLEVHSVVGKGSTFSFLLPLATDEEALSVKPADIAAHKLVQFFDAAEPETVLNQTFLLIEDDAALSRELRERLEQAGHLVIETDDGQMAAEMALTVLPDAILLDVQPAEYRNNILDTLKMDPQIASIPVIVCSPQAEPSYARLLSTFYLHKPFSVEQAFTLLEECALAIKKNDCRER